MNSLVSIVIPVYNSEKHIEKCLKSVLAQTYSNIEIIIVDDGSTDNTLNLCKKIIQNDTRVKIISINNSGVSTARNIGIKNAKGKYIQFVDSDDFIDNNMTELLVNTIEKDGVDLVVCGYKAISADHVDIINLKTEYRNYSIDNLADNVIAFFDTSFFNSPCNKLYVKEMITAEFTNKYQIAEDYLFNLHYLDNISSFSIIVEPLYNYIENSNSATHSIQKNRVYKQIEAYHEISRWFDEKFHDCNVNMYQQASFGHTIVSLVFLYAMSDMKYKTFKKMFKQILNDEEIRSCINIYKPKSFKQKIMRILCMDKNLYIIKFLSNIRKCLIK